MFNRYFEIREEGTDDSFLLCFYWRLLIFLDFLCSSTAEKSTERVAYFQPLLKGPDSRLLNTRDYWLLFRHIMQSAFLYSDPREVGMICSLKCHYHRAEDKSNDVSCLVQVTRS